MGDCIFCKIIAGEIPARRLYEDRDMIIIRDINPRAKIHLLLIPKEHYSDVASLSAESAAVLGRCLLKLGELQKELGIEDGFRLVVNKGAKAGQSVFHLHIHILAGQAFSDL